MYNRKLIEYLPEAFKTVEENEAILTMAEQPEMVDSWGALDNAMNNQFILDATEYGISRLEKIMKIIPKANHSLDDRKFTVLARNNEQPPFTMRILVRQLETLCGEGEYSVSRDVDKKILKVRIALTSENKFNDVADLLERIVPADMIIDLDLMYITHFEVWFNKLKHENLASYTHKQIRKKEVLTDG